MSIHKFDNKEHNLSELLTEMYLKKYNIIHPDFTLDHFHQYILPIFPIEKQHEFLQINKFGVNDRQLVFIKDYYQYVDSSPLFLEKYTHFIKNVVKPIYPEETSIYFQTTPNLRISFPGSTAIGRLEETDPSVEIVGLHSDGDFGHADHEINFVFPITRMFDTNSIYYETERNTPNPADFANICIEENELFSDFLSYKRHYNKINQTEKTRMSLDFRIILGSQYTENSTYSVTAKKKFVEGDYFTRL
jgi:hypothetical protein